MKKILVHSFILAIVNIAGVLAGFGVYKLSMLSTQILIQGLAAAVLSVIGFMVWYRFVRRNLPFDGLRQVVWIYLSAFVWFPIIFVPLHYLSQGYLTDLGNITSSWAFQVPVNALALLAAGWVKGRSFSTGS
jgi:hypothetical protein